MDWSLLFCNGCEGAYGNPPGGLNQIWTFVAALLNWDIIKGLIVFMLAMMAGGQVLAMVRSAVAEHGALGAHMPGAAASSPLPGRTSNATPGASYASGASAVTASDDQSEDDDEYQGA